MSDPLSLQILEAVEDRLETILVAGGYNTDAGQNVFLGVRRINPNELADGSVVLNVFDTDDEVDETTAYGDEEIHVTLRITVEAYIRDLTEQGTRLAHLVMQDIKTAVLTSDRTLGGLTVDFGYDGRSVEYPDPGGDTLTVSVDFVTTYAEAYGAP